LDYLVVKLGREAPDILDLKADMPSLEEAKYVSFPTLQSDIGKIEAGLKILVKHREDMKRVLDSGPNPSFGATPEVFQKLSKYEEDITATVINMKSELLRAQTEHLDLAVFLGEDPKVEPETLYGQMLSFVSSVESCVNKKLKRRH
jgi:hypothetical protein